MFHFKKENFFFGHRLKACGLSVSQQGVKPAPPALRVQSLNHWTTKDVPASFQNKKQKNLSLCRIKHGNPLQYSCLENPMDRGAWPATVHGVTKSQT